MNEYRDPTQSGQPRPRRPLSTGWKVFWIFAGALALFAITTVGAVAYAVHTVASLPDVEVTVSDRSAEPVSFSLSVPAAVVVTGMRAAPLVVPHEEWRRAREEMRSELGRLPEGWDRALRDLGDELARMPDVTLVEVHDGHDHVRLEKRGQDLRIVVHEPDTDVEVVVPVQVIDRVLAFVNDELLERG